MIGGGTGGVEGLDHIAGEGQGYHCLTGWFYYQQGRPESRIEMKELLQDITLVADTFLALM